MNQREPLGRKHKSRTFVQITRMDAVRQRERERLITMENGIFHFKILNLSRL